MRAVWPEDRPISVRISAHDWVEGGITPDDAVRDRARLQGGRRRPDRLLVGPGQQAGEAGLRPHVPDAVRRPHPQRGRHRDHRGRRDLRGRSRQQHHRRRPRRPLRGGAAAPGQSGLDADRGGARSATRRSPGRKQYRAAKRSSSATSQREKRAGGDGRSVGGEGECKRDACSGRHALVTGAGARHRRRDRARAGWRRAPRVTLLGRRLRAARGAGRRAAAERLHAVGRRRRRRGAGGGGVRSSARARFGPIAILVNNAGAGRQRAVR